MFKQIILKLFSTSLLLWSFNLYAINEEPYFKWWGEGTGYKAHDDNVLLNKKISYKNCISYNTGQVIVQEFNLTANENNTNIVAWGLLLHSGHKNSIRKTYHDGIRGERKKVRYTSVVPYVVITSDTKNNSKFNTVNTHLLLPLDNPINSWKGDISVGYAPSCDPIKSLNPLTKNSYQKSLAYYSSLTLYFSTVVSANVFTKKLIKENKYIVLIQKKIDNNETPTMYREMVESIAYPDGKSPFSKLKNDGVTNFFLASITNDRFGSEGQTLMEYSGTEEYDDRNSQEIEELTHNEPSTVGSDEEKDLSSTTPENESNEVTKNDDQDVQDVEEVEVNTDFLKGELCGSVYEYKIERYSIDDILYDEVPEDLNGKILKISKINSITENENFPDNIEFTIEKNNETTKKAFNKKVLFSTVNRIVKQGVEAIKPEKTPQYYINLTACENDITPLNLSPKEVDACTTIKLEGECKQSIVETVDDKKKRVFHFPKPPIKITFPTLWGNPDYNGECSSDENETNTILTCEGIQNFYLNWPYYKPIEISNTKTLQLSDMKLKEKNAFEDIIPLSGTNQCNVQYQYEIKDTINLVSGARSIYPIKVSIKPKQKEFSAFTFDLYPNQPTEDIKTSFKEHINKQKIKVKINDDDNAKHSLKLLTGVSMRDCRKAEKGKLFDTIINQQQELIVDISEGCFKLAKIDNIGNSCLEITGNKVEFTFKQPPSCEGKRKIIVIEQSEKLAVSVDPIRTSLKFIINKAIGENNIPAFDIVGLTQGSAKLILRCEDFQNDHPVNAKKKFLDDKIDSIDFNYPITQNPFKKFDNITMLEGINLANSLDWQSILYINEGFKGNDYIVNNLRGAEATLKSYADSEGMILSLIQLKKEHCNDKELNEKDRTKLRRKKLLGMKNLSAADYCGDIKDLSKKLEKIFK